MITINPNTYNGFDILCRVYENQSQSYWRSVNRDENKQICAEVLFSCKTFPDAENKQATAWLPIGAAQFMIENIKDRDNYEIIIDRSKAIKRAIDVASPGDMVMVLGKGNETYEKLKDRVIYFNDIEECKKHLSDRLKVTNR